MTGVKLCWSLAWQVTWTTGQRICIAPFEAEEGDVIVELEGAQAATLIRHADRYQYIGMASVEGRLESIKSSNEAANARACEDFDSNERVIHLVSGSLL